MSDETTGDGAADEGVADVEASNGKTLDQQQDKSEGDAASAVAVRRVPTRKSRGGIGGGARRWLIVGAAAILLIAAAAALTVTGMRYGDARRGPDDAKDAVAAARVAAEAIFGYNPKTVDKNAATAQSMVTGNAQKVYSTLLNENNLVLTVKKNNVNSDLAIQGIGAEQSSANSAQVLLFMNQSVTRNNNQLVDIKASRVVFDMKRIDGKWKVDDINQITDNSVNKSLLPQGQTPTNAEPGIGGANGDASEPNSAAPQPQSTATPAPTAGP